MTKKHFVAIARILRGLRCGSTTIEEMNLINRLSDDLARYFATQNPLFKHNRFINETEER